MKFLTILLPLLLILVSCSNEKDDLPEEILDLKLVNKMEGEEAKNFVNKLHFNSVTDEENRIGFYEGNGNEAIIYITVYPDDESAKNNYKKMTEKISPENSLFINPEFLEIDGKEMYRCFGMGQSHYVFTLGNKLLWLSVTTHIGKKFVEEYLQLFQ